MFTRDRDGTYLWVNAEFCRASGLNEEEIVGKNSYELFPQRAADYQANDDVIWATKKPFTYQETGMVEGEERIFLIFKFPLISNGEMYALGGLSVDITDSVEELKESIGLVGRLSRSLEQSQSMLRALQMILPQ